MSILNAGPTESQAVIASAPASSNFLAKSPISSIIGGSLTITGIFTLSFASLSIGIKSL